MMSLSTGNWICVWLITAGIFTVGNKVNAKKAHGAETLTNTQDIKKNSLSQRLWDDSSDIANKALNTPFIQGLRNGTLPPTKFGAYVVQDAVYLEKIADTLWIAYKNVSTGVELQEFFIRKALDYTRYAKEMYNDWQLSSSSCVKLDSGCQAYLDYKMKVATDMEPYYTLVSMIPCLKLWPWIGAEIRKDTPNFGVYKKWLDANFDPSYEGYKQFDSMVDDFYTKGLIDATKAMTVYKNCMNGEYLFFNRAME